MRAAGLGVVAGGGAGALAAIAFARLSGKARRPGVDLGVWGRLGRDRRVSQAVGPVAADVGTGLSAGLSPIEALEFACRRRSDPLSRSAMAACRRARRGAAWAEVLREMQDEHSDPRLSSLCIALDAEMRTGRPALEPVQALARSALATRKMMQAERAARAAPLIQLVVALGLVPAALMILAAVALAGFGHA